MSEQYVIQVKCDDENLMYLVKADWDAFWLVEEESIEDAMVFNSLAALYSYLAFTLTNYPEWTENLGIDREVRPFKLTNHEATDS